MMTFTLHAVLPGGRRMDVYSVTYHQGHTAYLFIPAMWAIILVAVAPDVQNFVQHYRMEAAITSQK